MITITTDHLQRGECITLKGIQATVAVRMTGSDKQVSWASEIASRLVSKICRATTQRTYPNGLMSADQLATLVSTLNSQFTQILAHLDGKPASAWIDARDMEPMSALKAVRQA